MREKRNIFLTYYPCMYLEDCTVMYKEIIAIN